MSFADFAGGNTSAVGHTHNGGGFRTGAADVTAGLSSKSRQAIDGATLKLEQFNRQVLAIKRGASNKGGRTAPGAVEDELNDRIRFACLLQEELAKALRLIPQESANALLKKKLCKDFEAISNQLETAVVKLSAQEQAIQSALVAQQAQDGSSSTSGRIVAEHQGQVIEFQALENEIAHNEAMIEEREKDIDKIHQSVAQVQEIFRDLAAIVSEQQTAIDEIETNVHDTLDKTQRGRDEVQKAADMQSRCVLQ